MARPKSCSRRAMRRLSQLGDTSAGGDCRLRLSAPHPGQYGPRSRSSSTAPRDGMRPPSNTFSEAGNDWGIGEAHASLGAVGYCTGNHGRAATRYVASLEQGRTLRYPLIGELLTARASRRGRGMRSARGRCPPARRGGGARIASLGAPAYPRDQPVRARALAALTAALGEEQLAAAREAGRALTLEVAITEAQAVAAAVMPSP